MKFKRRSFKSHREKESEQKFYLKNFVEYFFSRLNLERNDHRIFKEVTNFKRGVYLGRV